MVFTRSITPIMSMTVLPGKTSYAFTDLGGSAIDPFLLLTIDVLDLAEVGTYDFETDELSGIGTIKFSYLSHIREKIRLTEEKTLTPLLIMQDLSSPLAYVYPDTTAVGYPEENYYTKSGKQELNYPRPGGLPLILEEHFTAIGDITLIASIPRYAIKGNWHFFANSIVCDIIEFNIRPRLKTGLLVTSYSFL